MDAIILYSHQRRKLLANEINNDEKLFVANNTLDSTELNKVYEQLEALGKEYVKKELAIKNKYNIVFIGRLVPEKRLDMLLEIFQTIQDQFSVGLHIIGNGPEEEMLRMLTKDNPSIHYHGAIHNLSESSRYLFAADLMVMPGHVGLSVVHAMMMGCPVLTCQGPDGPFHAPEAEYIHNGVNGLFCAYSVKSLAEKIIQLFNDENSLKKMSAMSRKTMLDKASINLFLSGFADALKYVNE
jgi:glycosyltransferase involved in cell wall biosynthesis